MKNLAIIPARGGSKRIPRKNVKDFLGKPIIAYSIQTAIDSQLFDEIMVSTDDEEIANIAMQYGAKVPFMRSKETADDYAPLADVVNEVIAIYKEQGNYFDNFCCILSTAPFITSKDIIDAYDIFRDSQYETIRPVTKFSYPIQRAFKLKEDNGVEWFYPEYTDTRSQDLEIAYHDAGLFYWGKTHIGLNTSSRGAIVVPETKCQDIDTIEDWIIAEAKFEVLKRYEK
jgi:N-acylneuraminate cytidylyltransferase